MVYVDKIPIHGKKMEGILIYDERDKGNVNTIFAQEGFLISHPSSQEVALKLLNGNIHRFESRTKAYQRIKFDAYDLKFEIANPRFLQKEILKNMRCRSMRLKRKLERRR